MKIGKCCGSCKNFEHDIYDCYGECLKQFQIAANPNYKKPLYLSVELYYVCDLWELKENLTVDNI